MFYKSKFSADRRHIMGCALATSLIPFESAIARMSKSSELELKLYNVHTTESVQTVFWADGEYQKEGLRELDYLLRDHRANKVGTMDIKLYPLLALLNKRIGNNKPISIISGYRSAETNRMLARNGSGVAKNSYHIKGQAIDFRINGKDTRDIRDIGIKLGVGGVGYYQPSNFVHFDTGPRRSW